MGDLDSIPGLGRSPGEGNGNPLQHSYLENSIDGGAWWAAVHGVAKSRTRLSDFTLQPSEMMGMLIILTMVMISQIYTFIKTTCAIKYAQPHICQLLSH